jgi:CHAT domain-containing protein
VPRGFTFLRPLFLLLLLLLLLVLIRLRDTLPNRAEIAYDHAGRLFQQGYFARSQDEAELGYRQFARSSQYWAAKFQLLEAESMLFRGMYDGALGELESYRDAAGQDGTVEKLTIEAVALTRQGQPEAVRDRLARADALCKQRDLAACGGVLSAHAIFAIKSGDLAYARRSFLDALTFAREHNDRWLRAASTLNLGYLAMQLDHYDEAVEWSRAAYKDSVAFGFRNLVQSAAGNLGWAYYQLGDSERALEQFRQAEASAEELGAVRLQLKWLSTAGYVYQDSHEWTRALDAYQRSLYLARQIGSKEDIVNALNDLAAVSAESGNTDQASGYLDEITKIEGADADNRNAQLRQTRCVLASARHQLDKAESCLRAVRNDESVLVSNRLDAGYRLAELYESRGDYLGAEEAYRSALDMYESARARLKTEESELPFGANASQIFDSYIHLLMQEGRSEEALAIADQSRAETLEKGVETNTAKMEKPALNPRQIAQRAGATLLFYWLGEKQSYLWVLTPSRISAFTLPPRQLIADRVNSYTQRIIDLRDPQRRGDLDGESLYKILVAPASALIQPAKPVVILADGELSQLNFETLLVPDRKETQPLAPDEHGPVHYLLDDLTIVSAPSLAMLQSSKARNDRGGKILLLGDPVSPSADFPSLPLFSFEMNKIESHFDKARLAVIAGQQATPATYLASNPAQYAYIHFVSHAVANRIVPLDSAIVLSKSSADENSFKLYARDIIQHPIDAKLVTISACYGNGTRFYAGEGLVGLSWAFLHAGAQRVIGALWEVSDESTPRLMDGLYQGIAEGKSPAVSLHNAKLALLHSQSRFSLPFYWATFQIYDRQ